MTLYADTFVRLAESQLGDRYVWAAKEPATDPNPKAHGGAFDCSGLVAWAVRRAGLPAFPDGSANQLEYCIRHGGQIGTAAAERTRGALLFLGPGGNEHVVICRGNGTTIEARGAAYGVGEWSAYRDAWSAAAIVPGFDYTAPAAAPAPRRQAFTTRIQLAVGFTGPAVDGIWGVHTESAVIVHRRRFNDPVVGHLQRVFRTLPGQSQLPIDNDWGRLTDIAYAQAHRGYFVSGR